MRISIKLNQFLSLGQARKISTKKAKKPVESEAESRLKVKIGLEIHARINSDGKIFSDSKCKNLLNSRVNSKVSVFDAALPGTMPTLNRRCVEASLLTALALKCNINCVSSFERKHYFYADLPAGYQITQQKNPIALNGLFNYPVINPKNRRLTYKQARIRRIQLEHDSARSLLTDDLILKSNDTGSTTTISPGSTLVDLNRVGMGLMEIVTEPDFDEAFDSYSFARELALILRSLGTCEAQMSDGGFRVDVNVSVHETDPNNPAVLLPGVRVELKNLNSFNAVLKATEYEIKRQKGVILSGGRVELETRTFDNETRTTISIRSKEDQYDYRFMPEPNLLPLIVFPPKSFKLVRDEKKCANNQQLLITDQFIGLLHKGLSPDSYVDFDKVRDEFEEKKLPQTRRDYIIEHFNVSHENAFVFVANNLDLILIEIEKMAQETKTLKPDYESLIQILLYGYLELINLNYDLDKIDLRKRCEKIISYSDVLKNKVISQRVKSVLFRKLFDQENYHKMAMDLVKELDLFVINDEAIIVSSIEKLFDKHPEAVQEYKGKEKKRLKLFDFFVGRVHKDLNDRAEPDLVDKLVFSRLKKLIE